jgi:heavy metal translocating P-type ATPase
MHNNSYLKSTKDILKKLFNINIFFCIFTLTIIISGLIISSQDQILADRLMIIPILTIGSYQFLQIFYKIIKGNLGADIIAFIALALAIYLHQYLTANLLILMIASGQSLEQYASQKASFVLEALAKRVSSIAHLKKNNEIVDVEINQIKIGDYLAILPHEVCPVDGQVVEGNSFMDESFLTGEPFTIAKTTGSKVISGALNQDNLLIIQATKLAKDSRYAKIVEVISNAKDQKPKIRKLADKIGAIFAPIALIIASLSYYFTGSIENFLAVLTIATPCPLLIAVPIAIISAISICATNGIIIKDPKVLENLPICSTIVFDKTGTLTIGEPQLSEIIVVDENFTSEKILQIIASLERYSRHPLANAVIKASKQKFLPFIEVQNIKEIPGYGMTGMINHQTVIITNRAKLTEKQITNNNIPQSLSGLECFVLIDDQVIGLIRFHDQPRPESHSFIGHLTWEHNFKKIILLSGDRGSEVDYLAKTLGINQYFSSQTPEQKLAVIDHETKLAPTVFVGDGINDAPALMIASVGIAFGKNNNIVSEAAGAVILDSCLRKLDQLLHISVDMRKIILQSAVGGVLASIIGMFFASIGMITPAYGAILQQLIDIVAIINALRLIFNHKISNDF